MSRQYGPYRDIASNLSAFIRNAETIALEEASKEDDELVRINTDDQLSRGLNSDGRKITPPYTPFTKTIKKSKGQPTNRVTLMDTGDFYKGFDVDFTGKTIYLDSSDKKTEKLVTKYGESIFGITKRNLTYFINTFLKPRVIDRFKKQLIG